MPSTYFHDSKGVRANAFGLYLLSDDPDLSETSTVAALVVVQHMSFAYETACEIS